MTGIFQEYLPRAQAIRNKHRKNAAMIHQNDCFTDEAKRDMQKKEKDRATAEMDTIKKAYKTAIETEKKRLVDSAFRCRAESKAEYLQILNSADNMDSQQRTAALKNAITIEHHNAARAYAFSAWNHGDNPTLHYARQHGFSTLTEPLSELMRPQENDLEQLIKLSEFSI
jgi:hypothetical protein